jgi:hypothetical protein
LKKAIKRRERNKEDEEDEEEEDSDIHSCKQYKAKRILNLFFTTKFKRQ